MTRLQDVPPPPIPAVAQKRQAYVNVFEDLSEEEQREVMDLAFGEAHVKELPGKVTRALEEDYDMSAGVNPNSRRPFPIKANIDLMVHRAKSLTDFNQRAALYQRCIDYNPTDGRAWLGLARIYSKKGQLDKAEKAYKDGLYYSPKNPFLLQSWAVQLEKQGKLGEATKMLTKSIKANTRHAASWVALAKIHQRTGRLEEARFCYSSACEGDDQSYVALQAWGTLESAAGNVALARDLFARAARASGSRSAHALQAWATLERRQGNLEEAQRLLDRAMRSNPQNSKVRTSYAEVHEMRGDFALARAAFEEGADSASKAGDAGFFQSWALFEFRQEEARLQRARSQQQQQQEGKEEIEGEEVGEGVAPSADTPAPSPSASAWPGLSDEAASTIRGLFKRAVTLNRFHSASWVAWAKFEQQSGNVAAARKLLVTGISNFPHSRNAAWFHCSLGRLSCLEGDLNTARACYDRALKSSPPQQSLNIFLESAKMEDQLGSAVAAKRLLEAAAKRFPWEDRAWDALVEFERRHATDPSLQTETQGQSQSQGQGQGQGQGQQGAEDAVTALQRRREAEQGAAIEARQSRSRKLDSFRQLSLSDLEIPDEATRTQGQEQGQDGGKRWRQGGGGERRRFDGQQEEEDEEEEFAGWAGLDRLFGGAP